MNNGIVKIGGPLALVQGVDPAAEHYTRRLWISVAKVTRRLSIMGGAETERELSLWNERFYSLPEDAARQLVSHPFFSYYWLQLLQACSRGDRDFVRAWSGHLGRFVLLPYLQAGPGRSAALRFDKPITEVRLPGHRFHITLTEPVERVEVAADGDGAVRRQIVRLPQAYLLGAGPANLGSALRIERPVIHGTAIEVCSSDPWIRRHLASMNTKPPMKGYPPPDLEPLAPSAEQLNDLAGAFRLIERTWPELVPEIKSYVQLCVPYASKFHSSFTEACLMGAVFLSEAKWPFSSHVYTAEHLLHEAGHLRLTLIEELDPLLGCAVDRNFTSPVRLDPRPLSGMLQTVFAFARIAAFHRNAYAATGDELHERRRAESADLLLRGLKEIEAEPSLVFTPTGEKLWAEMHAETVVQ